MAVANVGQNLQRARENAGFEQETAAPKLGVHPQTLSRYERGTVAKIPATILEKASNLYGVPMDRLISGLIESGESLGVSVSRGTEVSTPEAALPPSHAKLIRDFEREAARMAATDPELDHIHWSLRNPQSSRMFYMGDDGKPMTADEQLEELGFQIHGLRVWLQARLDKRTPKGKKPR